MLFNKSIILEILLSSFKDEIYMYLDEYIINFDEYLLDDIFNVSVDFAVFAQIQEMTVLNFQVESDESIKGVLQVTVLIDGYEKTNGQDAYKDSQIVVLMLRFRFCVVEDMYSDLQLTYL